MKQYLGVKIIKAEPMSSATFVNQVKNEDVPNGFVDKEGYKVVYEDGYTSWSPKEVFEKAYREIGDISVGAIGKRIATTRLITPGKVRMAEEAGQLVARKEKLENFIETSTFKTLDSEMQNLLTLQLNSMKVYLLVLMERFDRM